MTWRFDNRKNPFLFRDIMLNLIASDNLQYKGTHLSRCLGIEYCCQSLISAAVITGFNLVSHKQYGTSPFMPSSPIQPAQKNTYIRAVPLIRFLADAGAKRAQITSLFASEPGPTSVPFNGICFSISALTS